MRRKEGTPSLLFSPDLIKSLSLLSPLWFSRIAQLLHSWQQPRSMLIFGQNEMKDSVEWKARAESLGPSGVYCSPWKARNPKKMYWKGKKKIFKQLALEQTHKKIHQKATVFLVFYPSAWRWIPFGGSGAGNTCWGPKGQSRTCVLLQVPLAPHGLTLEGQREGERG